jgi:hypothetical protein
LLFLWHSCTRKKVIFSPKYAYRICTKMRRFGNTGCTEIGLDAICGFRTFLGFQAYRVYTYKTSWLNPIVRFVGHYTIYIPLIFLCEPMGRREIFHTFSVLIEIERHSIRLRTESIGQIVCHFWQDLSVIFFYWKTSMLIFNHNYTLSSDVKLCQNYVIKL